MPFNVYQLMEIQRIARSKKSSHRARGFKVELNTGDIIKRIMKGLKDGCAYCGSELQLKRLENGERPPDNLLTLDIVNPMDRRLSNDNMAIICCKCNQMKLNTPLEDFIFQCTMISDNLMVRSG